MNSCFNGLINLLTFHQTSAVFAGKEFCIVSGDDKTNKSNLEELAVKNGGSIVQNPGEGGKRSW